MSEENTHEQAVEPEVLPVSYWARASNSADSDHQLPDTRPEWLTEMDEEKQPKPPRPCFCL